MPVYHTLETCPLCSSVIVESLKRRPTSDSPQQHCAECGKSRLDEIRALGFPRAKVACVEVDGATSLFGFHVGERVECDLWRGGREVDSVVRGSKLATKAGRIADLSEVGTYRTIGVVFDDGDYQSCDAAELDGRKPGYPCASIRRAPVGVGS